MAPTTRKRDEHIVCCLMNGECPGRVDLSGVGKAKNRCWQAVRVGAALPNNETVLYFKVAGTGSISFKSFTFLA